jgi:hypothetical protein
MRPYGERPIRRWTAPWIDIDDAERPSERRLWWIRLLSPSRWEGSARYLAALAGLIAVLAGIVATQQGLEALKHKRDRVPQTLAALGIGQEQFRQQCQVDEDFDGDGEYGWFGELSGSEGSGRQSGLRMGWSPLVPAILGVKDRAGRSTRYDRWFRMYLPDASGVMRQEPAPLPGGWGNYDAAGAPHREQRWACAAWQKNPEAWDPRAFYVDQYGVVWETGGEVRDYRGSAAGPLPSEFQPVIGSLADYAKTLQPFTAKDGNVWRPARRALWATR